MLLLVLVVHARGESRGCIGVGNGRDRGAAFDSPYFLVGYILGSFRLSMRSGGRCTLCFSTSLLLFLSLLRQSGV